MLCYFENSWCRVAPATPKFKVNIKIQLHVARVSRLSFRFSWLWLFQGGLEIRCVITVTIIATVCGHLLLQRYEQFVKTLYAEPKNKVIVGSYLTKTDLAVVHANDGVRAKKKKKNTKDKNIRLAKILVWNR